MVFQPIYRNGAPMDTAAQRRRAITGFAVGAFDAAALGNSVLDGRRPGTSLQIIDHQERIYGPPGGLEAPVTERVNAAGRVLELRVSVPAKPSSALPATILGGGFLFSGLVALVLLAYSRRERYAQDLSDRRLAERERGGGSAAGSGRTLHPCVPRRRHRHGDRRHGRAAARGQPRALRGVGILRSAAAGRELGRPDRSHRAGRAARSVGRPDGGQDRQLHHREALPTRERGFAVAARDGVARSQPRG